MPIPKQSPAEIYSDDLKRLEQNPDTIELQFYEASPNNKTLFTLTPAEHGVLTGIGYSVGPDDASVNGYSHILFSRIENANMYSVVQANNQSMWNRFFYGAGDKGLEHFLSPLYLYRNEPFYIQMVSNYPAGVNVLGNFTLYLKPTFR
jgi:hypothetical protein